MRKQILESCVHNYCQHDDSLEAGEKKSSSCTVLALMLRIYLFIMLHIYPSIRFLPLLILHSGSQPACLRTVGGRPEANPHCHLATALPLHI